MRRRVSLFLSGLIIVSFICILGVDLKKEKQDNTVLELHEITNVERLREDGKDSTQLGIHVDTLEKNNEFLKSDALPSSYSSKDLNYVTSPKNQGDHGTCWAFSAVSAVETNLIKKGLVNNSIDLSEAQLAYFAYNKPTDTLGLINDDRIINTSGSGYLHIGGNYYISSFTLGLGIGMTDESVMKYEELNDTATFQNSLAFDSKYMVRNSYMLNMTDKVAIKNAIKEYGAVTAAYYTDAEKYNFRTSNGTSYYQGESAANNHAITIVGWDDNYGKENFLNQPSGNGAWLVKNSWGDTWGDNGYFWLSYYDKGLLNSTGACYDADLKDEDYLHRYQHDGNPSLMYFEKVKYACNIYTAQSLEKITDVWFMSDANNIDYKVYVYKNVSKVPTDGQLVHIQSGNKSLAGTYLIELSKEIIVNKGEKFAIVIQATDSNKQPIRTYIDKSTSWGWLTFESNADAGESFVSYDNKNWIDTDAYENYNANCRIKALTKEVDVAFLTDRESPQKINKNVVLSVAGELSNKEVRFVVEDVSGNTKIDTGYTSNITYTWTPSEEGGYVFKAYVKDKSNGAITVFTKDYVIEGIVVDSVSNLRIAKRIDTEMTLTWNKVGDATGYYILIKKGDTWHQIGDVREEYCTVTNLAPATSHTIAVQSYVNEGQNVYVSDKKVEISAYTAPTRTSNIAVTSRSSNSIDFKWNSVALATGYRVYMFTAGKWTLMSTQKGTSYSAKSLQPNGNYGFYVQAYREDNQGVAYSSQCTTKYINTAPGNTSQIHVLSRNTNAINLTWNKVSGATGYQVFMLQNGRWILKSTQKGLNYVAAGLGTGSAYSFMIKAYRTDSDGTVVSSVYTTRNMYTSPGVTTKVVASAIKTNSMKLTWYGVNNATGYRVYKKVGKKYVNVGTVTGRNHTVTGLNPATTYQFAVKAFRKDSDGVAWASSYKVLKYKTAPGVTARIAGSRSKNAVKLTWNKVSGASGYKVYIRKGKKWVLKKTLTGRTYTIKGLKRKTTYQFAVRAYTKYGSKTIMSPSYRTAKAKTR